MWTYPLPNIGLRGGGGRRSSLRLSVHTTRHERPQSAKGQAAEESRGTPAVVVVEGSTAVGMDKCMLVPVLRNDPQREAMRRNLIVHPRRRYDVIPLSRYRSSTAGHHNDTTTTWVSGVVVLNV